MNLRDAFPKWSDHVERLRKLQKRVHRDLDEASVHELRVLTRRLRSILWLAKQCEETPAIADARKALRRLGRALGDRRDLDIGIQWSKHYDLDTSEFTRRYAEANRELEETLERKSVQRLASTLKDVGSDLKNLSILDATEPLHRMEVEFRLLAKNLPKTAKERHEMRIRMKKARYLLEELALEEPLMKKLQDHLGKERDLSLIGAKGLEEPKREARRERKLAEKIMSPTVEHAVRGLEKAQRQFVN